jgi:GT2 family glycosyltransferase
VKLGIQILNFNGLKWLPDLLVSLKENALFDQKIYLVDNASTDESVTYVEQEHPDVIILRNETNLGYAAAYNRSIPIAFSDGCDWVCLQNTDTLVNENWLEPMQVAANSNSQIGIMGPVFVEWENNEPNYYMRGRAKDVIPYMFDASCSPSTRDWVEGSVLLIRKECYEDIGGLDPLYFMYWEEADYCRKAKYHNWEVVMVPGSICRHYGSGSSIVEGVGFLQIRNHLFFKITDPNFSFSRNIVYAGRLTLTYLKSNLIDKPNLSMLLKIIRSVFSACINISKCFQSWQANRQSIYSGK